MLTLSTPPHLPGFDQAATDRRFLDELGRLLDAGAFASYRELAARLATRAGVFAEIEAGRYHCNLRLLYGLAQHFPQADLAFIVFGSAGMARPEPAAAPARQRGRRPAGRQRV